MQPIRPSEVEKAKQEQLPDAVIDIFNQAIVQHYSNGESCFPQSEVEGRIAKALGLSVGEVIDKHYLDVEDAYRKNGWEVVFNKHRLTVRRHRHCETYEATFTFRKKK